MNVVSQIIRSRPEFEDIAKIEPEPNEKVRPQEILDRLKRKYTWMRQDIIKNN